MEDYYLVCIQCGAAFSELRTFHELINHQTAHMAAGDWEGWEIQPESEAF